MAARTAASSGSGSMVIPRLLNPGRVTGAGVVGISEGILLSRQIDQARLRAERHRVPVVSA